MDYSKVFSTWWFGVLYHEEQLEALKEFIEIEGYAYILHDKDIDFETSEPKKPHFHFLVKFVRNQKGAFFKRLSTDDMGQVFAKPCSDPQGAFDYLLHDTPRAIKEGKYLYPASERISTLDNFEPDVKEEKLDYKKVRELINNGETPSSLILNYNMSKQLIEYSDRYYFEFTKCNNKGKRRDIKVCYIYGKTGVGKTISVMDKFGDDKVYRVTDYEDQFYFDNYEGEDIVVFEEFRSQIPLAKMLSLLDRYSTYLRARYNNKIARFTKVYILSNWELYRQYENVRTAKPDDWQAFLRRITEVYNYDKSKDVPINKGVASLKPLSEKETEQCKWVFDNKFLAK